MLTELDTDPCTCSHAGQWARFHAVYCPQWRSLEQLTTQAHHQEGGPFQ